MPTFLEVPMAEILKRSDLLATIFVVAVVVMIIVPLPTFLLDLLLAFNITISMIILLISMYTKNALEFSIFPSVLLITTLLRLALNISSTRLILLLGNRFDGQVIKAFGDFVVGGNYVVGIVIFLIITVIQFVVITKGAGRVAEVAARFTLDAMPGKQMSIDADLNAGVINDDEARTRRKNLQRESDFYGAMDGASKFVQGDAVAGIVITIINVLAGFVIGVFQHGLTMAESATVFTLLSIGDGLVSQVPALLISTATGIIVTRSSSESNLGANISTQMFNDARVLGISAGALAVMGLMPGLPKTVFFLIAAIIGSGAYLMGQAKQVAEVAETEKKKEEAAEQEKKPENVAALLVTDPLELEIGYGLVPLVTKTDGGILERIHLLRKQIALEIGLIVPPIRIRDNIQLKPESYIIKIKGNEVAKNDLMVGHYLAMGGGGGVDIPGIQTTEPSFGLPAVWITESQREQAEMNGYMVADIASVLATHIQEVIKKHARELLGRTEIQTIINTLKESSPELMNEVVSNDGVSPGTLQKVLQNLLEEGISIRNMLRIIEALGECIPDYRDNIDFLTEYARGALARQISQQYLGPDGYVQVITMDPDLEEKLANSIQRADKTAYLALDPRTAQALAKSTADQVNIARTHGIHPVVLTAPGIRPYFRRFIVRVSPALADVTVISHNELDHSFEVRSIGMISA